MQEAGISFGNERICPRDQKSPVPEVRTDSIPRLRARGNEQISSRWNARRTLPTLRLPVFRFVRSFFIFLSLFFFFSELCLSLAVSSCNLAVFEPRYDFSSFPIERRNSRPFLRCVRDVGAASRFISSGLIESADGVRGSSIAGKVRAARGIAGVRQGSGGGNGFPGGAKGCWLESQKVRSTIEPTGGLLIFYFFFFFFFSHTRFSSPSSSSSSCHCSFTSLLFFPPFLLLFTFLFVYLPLYSLFVSLFILLSS